MKRLCVQKPSEVVSGERSVLSPEVISHRLTGFGAQMRCNPEFKYNSYEYSNNDEK